MIETAVRGAAARERWPLAGGLPSLAPETRRRDASAPRALARAGQTHLNFLTEQTQQIGVIPAGIALFAFKAALFRFLPPQ